MNLCEQHETKKFFFCIPCKEPFCPMCLLEDKVHEGHPRQNLKELLPSVMDRLRNINDGLNSKRKQMDTCAESISKEILYVGEQVTRY